MEAPMRRIMGFLLVSGCWVSGPVLVPGLVDTGVVDTDPTVETDESDPAVESDPGVDTDPSDTDPAVDTDPSDTDPAVDTDPPDTDPATESDASDPVVDTDPDPDTAGETETGACVEPLACLDGEFCPATYQVALDVLRGIWERDRSCQLRGYACTDATGRALQVIEWPGSGYGGGVSYFDDATGAWVATWQVSDTNEFCGERSYARWTGEQIVGCGPSPSVYLGCDDADLCDTGYQPPPTGDGGLTHGCDVWPDGVTGAWHTAVDAEAPTAVVAAGDVTGDGVSDVLVRGPGGRLHVHAGGAARATAPLERAGAFAQLGVGYSAAIGDVDGDGTADVVVGEPGFGVGGRLRLYRGPVAAGTTAATPTLSLIGAAGAGIGGTVVVVGDVDGDGAEELAFTGAAGASGGGIDSVVFVTDITTALWASGTASVPAAAVELTQRGAFAPVRVGDVDGDGRPDVGVLRPQATAGLGVSWVTDGTLWLVSGTALASGDLDVVARTVVRGSAEEPLLGVADAGQADTDAAVEVVVRLGRDGVQPGHSATRPGALGLLDAPPAGDGPVADVLAAYVDGSEGHTPVTALLPGDIDADGQPDLLVGAPMWGPERTCTTQDAWGSPTPLGSLQGAVFVVGAWRADVVLDDGFPRLVGEASWDMFGSWLARVGDVDDDGDDDVLVSATYAEQVAFLPTCP